MVWYIDQEQIAALARFEREYEKAMRREARREWWRKMIGRIWPRKSPFPEINDEVPF